MNVICRHCLKTNRIRKELRGKWTRCQFCHAEMEEPAPSAGKSRRKESAPAITPDPVTQAVAPVTSGSSTGGGFKFVLVLIAIGAVLYFRHWTAEQRLARERELASQRQFIDLLGMGVNAAGSLLSRPAVAPQNIGPSNPALRSPAPPRVERETTTLYDNDNNPVGKAYTTRVVPAQ